MCMCVLSLVILLVRKLSVVLCVLTVAVSVWFACIAFYVWLFCSLDRLVDEATVDSKCLSKRRMVCLCGVLVCVIGVLVGGLSCV